MTALEAICRQCGMTTADQRTDATTCTPPRLLHEWYVLSPEETMRSIHESGGLGEMLDEKQKREVEP